MTRDPIRPSIEALQANGIGLVAGMALGEPDLIPLWFGESDLVTPAFIRDAAKKALDDGKTFYSGSRGIMPLRLAVKDYHKRTTGVDVDVERISLPGAATLAVVTALQILCDTGDNVVIVSPIWPSIFQAAQMVGAEVRFARLDDDWRSSTPRWSLDLEKIFSQCDARTKAIFINSFSKAWAMTGWRIGWLVHPKRIADQLGVITIANNTGPTSFAQFGAIAALSPQGDAFRQEMRER